MVVSAVVSPACLGGVKLLPTGRRVCFGLSFGRLSSRLRSAMFDERIDRLGPASIELFMQAHGCANVYFDKRIALLKKKRSSQWRYRMFCIAKSDFSCQKPKNVVSDTPLRETAISQL